MSIQKTSRISWVWWFLVIAAIAGAGWYFWSTTQDEPTTYVTVPIGKGDVTQAVTATGTLNPVLNVQVGSQISGIIQKLLADFNTPVKEGQLIAQIDPGTYQAAVSIAEGDLANAEAAHELAVVNAARTRKLLTINSAAKSEVDASDAALHQSEAQIKIKKGSLEKARIDLARCTINAPISGIVISRSVDVGQTVAASLSAPVLFTIANDLTKMQIDANVAEADVGTVEVGQKVDFTVDAFPYRTFHGTVTQVRNAPLTVQNVVTYDTVISVDNTDLKLKPGMTANVSVLVAERQDVLKLPNAALRIRLEETPVVVAGKPPEGGRREGGGSRRRGGGKRAQTVYILPAGASKPQPKEVQLGISDGVSTEVVSGLNEGDPVVVSMIQPKSKKEGPAAPNPFTGGQRQRGR
ncbi:MAG: efflux RND transporter periplasmic adaptor subunit [Chthoniobacterales bacterium]